MKLQLDQIAYMIIAAHLIHFILYITALVAEYI